MLRGSYLSKPRILQCGGIIADVMGLGKTLTMLSAIVCSKQEMTLVESLDGMECESLRLTKATLVVLPSTRKYFASYQVGRDC